MVRQMLIMTTRPAVARDLALPAYQVFLSDPTFTKGPTCRNELLEVKLVIVTGGASGIGKATVRLFVKPRSSTVASAPKNKSVVDFDADEFDRAMRVNFNGVTLA
ncbi:hypothetical protein K1719_001308 [Acacia pycnantha]|nr:hypothetical protein K1719_001308 [Acacia pycnantha]